MKKCTTKNRQKYFLNLLNFVLMTLAWAYLYSQIKNHQSFFLQITDLWNELQKNKAILSIVFALMFVNWILEAKKWQILIKSLAKINLFQSLESVWVGLTLATFLPLGNYLGRAKNLPQKNRFDSAGALLVNGGLQFWVTMLGGIYGVSQFLKVSNSITFLLFVFWILIYLLGLFFYNKYSYKEMFVSENNEQGRETQIKREGKFIRQLRTESIFWLQKNLYSISQYFQKDILKTTFFALLRYGVFLLQMILIFKASGFLLSIEKIIVGSSLLFTAKSILPVGGFLVGLSVREAMALYFFGTLGENKVVTITFVLWIINIGVPVLIGSFLILKNTKTKQNQ
ncbi:hypothetical protein WAF17_01765 [Bernardetia sp. ABR2-2B]|uniref:hypothetical protein n=1 Tax=Bernardetia sp. ABR2-2B TaxID=3127472 RepID=UPI0030CE0C28